ADGHKLWDQSFGGTSGDSLRCVRQTADGGFILGGRSESTPNGNKTATHFGASDYWVIKLGPEPPRLAIPPQARDEIQRAGLRLLLIPGQTNRSYLLEYSANLADWLPIQTNRVTRG